MRRLALLFALATSLFAQQPNLRGIWQAQGNAFKDLEKGFVVDPANGKIPYKKGAKKPTGDPLLMCFQPGVPRAAYLPEPFQIFQAKDRVIIVYQHVHAYRVIFTDGRPHYDEGIEFYMGDSRGRWEGDTLVVDVTNFKPETWLDGAGNYHGNQLHVVERYTRTAPGTLRYEATIEDPEVYEKPWKIRLDLTQRTAQLVEHECERDAKGVYRHPPEFLKLYR